MKRATTLIIGFAAASCTLVSCASSKTTSSATATTNAAGGTAAAGGSGGAATTAAAKTGGGNPAKFCALSTQFQTKYNKGGALDNLSTDKPADVKAFFTSFDADLKTWEAAAPAEVKAAIEATTSEFTAIESILAKSDWDYVKAASQMGTITVNTGIADAAITLSTYLQKTCGISDSTTDTSATDTTPDASTDTTTA